MTQDRGRDATRSKRRLAIALILSSVVHIAPFPGYLLRGMIARSLWPGDETPLEDHGTLIPIELEEQEAPPTAELPPAEDFEDPESAAAAAAAKARINGDAGADAAADAAPDAAPDAPDASPDAVPDADAAPDAILDAASEADGEGDALPLAEDAQAGDGEVPGASEGGAGEGDGGGGLPPIVRIPKTEPSTPASRAARDAAADAPADAPSEAAPFTPIADPVALAGSAASLQRDPNVAAFIYPERIRRHPMGMQFGPVLSRHPQWNSFFANTNLDPIQDTDRIYLSGPQFRDTSQVAAVLRYRVPEARVRAAIAAVVSRSPGGAWLDAGVPAAKGHADKHDRIFVMPAPNMLVVVPPDGLAVASKVKSIPAQGGKELFVLKLRSARNALQGIPVDVPASLEGLRFSIESASDGGVNLRISVKDKDGAAAAAEHARRLTQDIDRFALVQVMFAKVRVFEPFSLQANGDVISGETHMNPAQLRNALSAIAAFIDSVPRKAP